MKCSNCGAQLPPGAAACPMCGTPTPQYGFGSGATPYDATVASSYNTPSSATPPPPAYDPTLPAGPYSPSPSTAYGSQPYSAPPPPQYGAPPPPQYTFPQPPPSPPDRSQGKRIAIIVGVGLLILILLGTGLFALLRPNNTSVSPTPTPVVHATTQATPTANGSQNPYPPNTGTLVVNDPLTDNSKGYKWDESSYSGTGTCGFTGGAYHITVQKAGLICVPEAKDLTLSNFAFEANITVVKGDNGGLAFRLNQVNGTFYDFDISTDGSYALKVYTTKYTTLSQGTNSVINKGLNQSNLLAVVANGDLITIYVNNQIIDSVHDKTLSQGQIGVLSFADNGPTNVIANNARAWKL